MKPGSDLSRALETVSLPTVGEVFADGTVIDLLGSPSSPARLSLVCRRGDRSIRGRRLLLDGRYYVPADLPATLVKRMSLPMRTVSYRSTRMLFDGLVQVFVRTCGLSAAEARLSAYFALATHFADCLPTTPSLAVIAANATDAIPFLRVLTALCRHALPLADFQPAALTRLPEELRPTLVISQSLLAMGTVRTLRASQYRGFGVLQIAGIADLCCPTAIAINEESPDELTAMVNLELYLGPDRSGPIASDVELKTIAANFQPRLLDYRLKNHGAVRSSTFDAREFDGAPREMARALGACIVGDPELQVGVLEVLKGQDESRRGAQWVRPDSIVVEALLVLCHEEERSRVYVGDIAEVANGILIGRKETVRVSARKVGELLRPLNVLSNRDSSGYNFLLLNDNRRRIHELARRFRLSWMRENTGRCEYCAAVMASRD
jgi:hypothetical protein